MLTRAIERVRVRGAIYATRDWNLELGHFLRQRENDLSVGFVVTRPKNITARTQGLSAISSSPSSISTLASHLTSAVEVV